MPFLRNSHHFVFDTQIIAQAIAFNMKIAEVPIHTIYPKDDSSTSMRANLRYGATTLWWTFRYRLHRLGLRSSIFRR